MVYYQVIHCDFIIDLFCVRMRNFERIGRGKQKDNTEVKF